MKERPLQFRINGGHWLAQSAVLGLGQHQPSSLFYDSMADARQCFGAGNHGTLTGFASPFTATSGPVWDATLRRWAWALSAAGKNYVPLTPAGFGTFIGQSSFVVSVWVKKNVVDSRQVIVGDWSNLGSSNSMFLEAQAANTWKFCIATGGGNEKSSIGGTVTTNLTHLLGVYDAVGATVLLYQNGVAVGAPSAAAGTMDAGVHTTMGRGGNYDGLYWDGVLSDFCVWKGIGSASQPSLLSDAAWSIDMGGLIQPVRTLWPGWSAAEVEVSSSSSSSRAISSSSSSSSSTTSSSSSRGISSSSSTSSSRGISSSSSTSTSSSRGVSSSSSSTSSTSSSRGISSSSSSSSTSSSTSSSSTSSIIIHSTSSLSSTSSSSTGALLSESSSSSSPSSSESSEIYLILTFAHEALVAPKLAHEAIIRPALDGEALVSPRLAHETLVNLAV